MEEFNLDEVDHLLTTTRAVRKRLDLSRTVPRELILDCVKVSTQAPAGGNYQKWRWVIVDDPEKKLVIAEAYRDGYAPYIDAQKKLFQIRFPMIRQCRRSCHLAIILPKYWKRFLFLQFLVRWVVLQTWKEIWVEDFKDGGDPYCLLFGVTC